MSDLIIVEMNAHESGHFTNEISQFCQYAADFCSTITILTPFGFKENLKFFENTKVVELCKLENHQKKTNFVLQKLYGIQWNFFNLVRDYIEKMDNKSAIIHIWDLKSSFPIWYHLRRISNKKILNLKACFREHHSIFGIKSLGLIQGILANKLLKKISDLYVVHTSEIYDEALKLGIGQNKIYKIGIGIENPLRRYTQNESRNLLNLQ